MPATETVREKTAHYAERIRPAAATAGQTARDAAATAGQTARDAAATAGQTAREAAQVARQAAQEYATEARDWASPRMGVAAEKVRDDVIPKVAGAVTAAMLASEPVREEAKTRGTAALAALKGETVVPKPKKRHRLRRLFLLTLLGGAAAAAWRAFGAKRDDDLWSTPMPGDSTGTTGSGWASADDTTTASTTAEVPAAMTEDAAGASPDEALSNAAQAPEEPTT